VEYYRHLSRTALEVLGNDHIHGGYCPGAESNLDGTSTMCNA